MSLEERRQEDGNGSGPDQLKGIELGIMIKGLGRNESDERDKEK